MATAAHEPVEHAAPPHSTAGAWPLVGRERELALALTSLEERSGLVVVGEAGTGKTRLAEEVRRAATDGLRWHVVIGSQGAARVPLGAWAHLLPEAWQPGDDDLATWRALSAGFGGDGGPVHLLVDDAQWLDAVSAGLVHHLVTTGRAKAIVTVRAGEPVAQPVTALWKDGYLARHDLEPLDARQAAALLDAALGAPIEPRTTRTLWQRSTGNLLMLRELVEAGRADGTLRLRHGAWVQARSSRPSPRLVDLLADRIEALEPVERGGAELVAVAEPIDADLVEVALGADLLGRLVARRVVSVDGAGAHRRVRSSHPLLAEVLVERMDEVRSREVVRTVVELVGRRSPTADTDRVRLAVWRLDAGLAIDGPDALEASELALARSDAALAETLARVAVAEGMGPAATIRLAEALRRQQRSAEAEAVLAPVADLVDDLDPPERLRYAEARALALSRDLGRLDDAIAVLERTLATMPEGRPRWALEARLAFVLADCGRLRAAEPFAEARLAGRDQDEVAALTALTASTMVRTLSGRGRDALALCDSMVPIALEHRDELPAGLGSIVAQRMLALYFLGDLAEAERFSAAVDTALVDDADPSRRAAVLMVRGLLAADAGRLDDALRLLRQSAALHELDNHRGYRSWTFAILARVHAQRGEVGAASAALAEARAALWPGGQVFSSDLDAAAMWVGSAGGRPAEVERAALEGIAHADAEGEVMVSTYLHHEALRMGLALPGHLEVLAAAAEVDQGARAAIWRDHAVAVNDDDGEGLEDAGHCLVGLGTHLVAAEAFARAAGAHHRAGAVAAATRAYELCRRELQHCPGAGTPALRIPEGVVGLTERELVVARRAARGDSNLEIAADLGVSVRTVETHLHRTFQKLGVNRRAALADVVGAG